MRDEDKKYAETMEDALFKQEVDVAAQNDQGNTLLLAVFARNLKQAPSPAYEAAEVKNIDLHLQLMKRQQNWKHQNKHGQNILHFLVKYSAREAFAQLLTALQQAPGFSTALLNELLNQADSQGNTPWHCINGERGGGIEALQKVGANICMGPVNKAGYSSLHHALSWDMGADYVKSLLASDEKQVAAAMRSQYIRADKQSFTPLQYAKHLNRDRYQPDVFQLLVAKQAELDQQALANPVVASSLAPPAPTLTATTPPITQPEAAAFANPVSGASQHPVAAPQGLLRINAASAVKSSSL